MRSYSRSMRLLPFLACVLLCRAAAVKEENTVLRSGCYEDSGSVTILAKGAPVTIRYALAGEAVPCYKVSVIVNGKATEGYLTAAKIDDLNGFDQARRNAAWLDLSQIMGTLKANPQSILAPGAQGNVAQQASALIEASQPARALELLEP